MNIAAITKLIKVSAKTSVKIIEKNAPLILQITGIAGMLGGTVMATRESLKADEVLKKYREEHSNDNDSKVVKIAKEAIAVAPCYVKTFGIEAASVVLLILSYRLNMKRIMALTAALSLSEERFKEFKAKTDELFGKDGGSEHVNRDIMGDYISSMDELPNEFLSQIIETVGGNVLTVDSVTGRIFYTSRNYVERCLNELNVKLRDEMYLTINDWYDILGLSHCAAGDDLGFIVDDYGRRGVKFDFDTELSRGGELPLMVIRYDYSTNPQRRY